MLHTDTSVLPRAAATRHPFVTGTVSALIRRHGIALWLRRIPVVPRPRPGVRIGG